MCPVHFIKRCILYQNRAEDTPNRRLIQGALQFVSVGVRHVIVSPRPFQSAVRALSVTRSQNASAGAK